MNKKNKYDYLSRLLHWSLAMIIVYASIAGYMMHFFVDSDPVIFNFLSITNMSLATLGFLLFIIRFFWKYFRPKIIEVEHHNTIESGIAELMHSLLYFTMAFVFITGFLMLDKPYSFFGLFDIDNILKDKILNAFFFDMHNLSCAVLAIIVVMHIAAAMQHQYIRKNNLLSRMT